jgi:hypothetical protein
VSQQPSRLPETKQSGRQRGEPGDNVQFEIDDIFIELNLALQCNAQSIKHIGNRLPFGFETITKADQLSPLSLLFQTRRTKRTRQINFSILFSFYWTTAHENFSFA